MVGWLVGKLCTNSISLFVKSISTQIVTAIPSENMTLLWEMTFETGKSSIYRWVMFHIYVPYLCYHLVI
jgi:uncharacterized protein YdgA (DUF945 family)